MQLDERHVRVLHAVPAFDIVVGGHAISPPSVGVDPGGAGPGEVGCARPEARGASGGVARAAGVVVGCDRGSGCEAQVFGPFGDLRFARAHDEGPRRGVVCTVLGKGRRAGFAHRVGDGDAEPDDEAVAELAPVRGFAALVARAVRAPPRHPAGRRVGGERGGQGHEPVQVRAEPGHAH